MSVDTQEPVEQDVAPSRVSPAPQDLSQAVVALLSRLAGETIKCTHVFGNSYRCNWWADDPSGIGGRIVRSKLVRAIHTPDGLAIEYARA